jgi:superfamily II DNA or RNA helicase
MSDRNDRQIQNRYIDPKINGRLFPSWVLANFKSYKLPEIIRQDDEDPCAPKGSHKLELRKYQEFLARYMDYKSPHRDILIYHGLGAGKTSSAINIYNMLYSYTPGWNVFVLIKATLKDHPWMSDLEEWLRGDEKEYKMKNIIFVSYDSPIADKAFMDAVKNSDTSKRSMYIIDEAHNFIRNVYSNISSGQGKRAQTIYDYMIQDKKENEGVRIVLLSGTPAINKPYELALMFNLLRPGSFPKSEAQFNQLYVSSSVYSTINEATKNMFQRRIMGLVSYYIGATPDYYASKKTEYIDCEMSQYQNDIYTYFEELEETMAKKKRQGTSGGSETYLSYTRQSCNFVFPAINQWVTGEARPRPNKFKVSEREAQLLVEGKDKLKQTKGSDTIMNVDKYVKTLQQYVTSFDDFLREKSDQDKGSNYTIDDDIKKYRTTYKSNYEDFFKNEAKKSTLFLALHQCSAKMINVIFNILKSAGPVLVYSNYVLMEGIEIFKIYLKYFGFSAFSDKLEGKDGFRYMEYHGGIDREERSRKLVSYNKKENMHGAVCKIIMISPAGAEGLSLRNVRQVHLLEPYWNEVRMVQMIGRAVRQCSHRDLPMEERHVDVFRYKSVRNPEGKKGNKWTTDQFIENIARSKDGLIQSFTDTVKEVAIDCELNKNHNMMAQEYKCFKFEEPALFEEQIGPAYKDDIYDDMKVDNGSNSTKSITVKVKVMKIKAVKQLSPEDDKGIAKYSREEFYWYNPENHTVYDFELHFAIGKVATDDDNLAKKINKDVYIIDRLIPIPLINEKFGESK